MGSSQANRQQARIQEALMELNEVLRIGQMLSVELAQLVENPRVPPPAAPKVIPFRQSKAA